jgi:hypothetical protein
MKAHLAWVVGLAAVIGGCGSADSQTLPVVEGALRARSSGGADLGLVYNVEQAWQFTPTSGTGTAGVAMVLLKEQPAGAPSPVLVYRSVISGSPLPCNRYYDGSGCTGNVTLQANQMGTACISGGRMYRPDFSGTAGAISFQSAELQRFDGSTQSLVLQCVNTPGTTHAFMLPAVDAGPAGASPGRIRVEPAD